MKMELGIAGRLAHSFLNSKLTPLIVVASLAIGVFAVAVIPREEEPQIVVPMLDITTAMPGASPAEVEQRVTLPIEALVHQISGVEYVYSTSSPGQSLVIVRFLVGTPQDDALIKVYSKLYSNFDRIPAGGLAAHHQSPLHRRCPHPVAHAVGRTLQRLPASRHCRRDAAQHPAGCRCVGNQRHRRTSAHHARSAESGKVKRLRPVADGDCRTFASRQCKRAGGEFR